MKLNYPHLPAKAGGSGGFLFPLSVVAQRPQAPFRSFMTEEERFSTIKITKKTKNADSSSTYASLRGGGLLGKEKRLSSIKGQPNFINDPSSSSTQISQPGGFFRATCFFHGVSRCCLVLFYRYRLYVT